MSQVKCRAILERLSSSPEMNKVHWQFPAHPALVSPTTTPRLKACPPNNSTPTSGPMITATISINCGRSSKFTHPNDGRMYPKYLDQQGQRLMHSWLYQDLAIFDQPASRKNIAVIIPTTEINLNERHANFNQTPGHQTTPSKIRLSVSLPSQMSGSSATL